MRKKISPLTLSTFDKEGLENRFARHAKLNNMIHVWLEKYGFEHFAPEGNRSKTLTTIANNKDIGVSAFIKALRAKYNILINGGYGKIKGTTFRISNMGSETTYYNRLITCNALF